MGIKFDYSFEEAQRLAALEEELGEIGGGGSAIGGWAQANRRHNEAIAALQALSHVFGMIADYAVFCALFRSDSAHVQIGSKSVSVVLKPDGCDAIDGTPCRRWSVWVEAFVCHAYDGDAYPMALRALRAAVDARLVGSNWAEVYAAARRAANGGER